MLSVLQTSAQSIFVSISNVFGGTDLTLLPVAFAFLEGSTQLTAETIFYTGSWETSSGNLIGPWVAYVPVGPGTPVGTLVLDSYTLVVQITPGGSSPTQLVTGQFLVVDRAIV